MMMDSYIGFWFYFIMVLWQDMMFEILVNIGWGNGLLSDGTKPLHQANVAIDSQLDFQKV